METTREPCRIVLVDDEEALVWSLASRLTKARPRDKVETANDGASALTLLSKERIDLLVADIRMPGMSGIDLVLTARGAFPDLPVILMTAYQSSDLQRVTTGPFTELLDKPFEFEKLLALIERALTPPAKVGFSGAISVQTLPDIVQLYALSSATGVLTVKQGTDVGEIWFDHGNVRHAVTPNARGDEAVYETMMWSGGEFSMRVGVPSPESSVSTNWQELLMESCRRIDEGKRAPSGRTGGSGWTQAPPAMDVDLGFEAAFDDFEPATTARAAPNVPPLSPTTSLSPEVPMNIKESLAALNTMDGFVGAALVDVESGMLLGQEGGNGVNLEVAAAGNTEVVKAKRKTMGNLGLKDSIEDILITLGKQYHIIRPLRSRPNLFFYVALDRTRANLAMARIALGDVEKDLQV